MALQLTARNQRKDGPQQQQQQPARAAGEFVACAWSVLRLRLSFASRVGALGPGTAVASGAVSYML